ncbi:S-layer homology domain-containing protein [Paenibacillus lautus]|uniref:S-layer homology domain-containing protein n=1 Tax=Paenibacillus lautus TaxID=1401 RepID=UPI003D29880E
MHIKTKQKKWWKRSLTVMLSLTLVASSISLTGLPEKAQAADVSTLKTPGGIDTSKLALWVKADSAETDVNGNVTAWKDETNKNVFSKAGSPKIESSSVNFNPSVTFDGTEYLTGNQSISMRETYAVAMWNGNTKGTTDQTSKGVILSPTIVTGYAKYYFWNNSTLGGLYSGDGTYSKMSLPNDGEYNLWNAAQGISRKDGSPNGDTKGKFIIDGIPQIGKRNAVTEPPAEMGNMNGNIAEIITLNANADTTERNKVDSYLALKYGITLNNGASNYVDTTDTLVWKTDATYKNNIAGIARDDAEALYQKQSRSINKGTQVVIGRETLVDTNSANNGTLADKQYLIWGDNGKELKFTKPVGTTDKNHAERIWKVQNTGSVDEVNIAIPKASVPAGTTLLVGTSETDFTTSTPYQMIEEKEVGGTDYYVTKAVLVNGQYFTFAADASTPISVKVEEITTNQNQIVVTFDKDIKLTAPEATGFTVTVGTETITLTDADVKVDPANPKQLLITLPQGTDTTGKSVKVEYNGQGNLTGTNGVPVNDFEIQEVPGVNKEFLQSKVDEATGLIASEYTPETWANYQNQLTAAQNVLGNPNATQAEVDQALADLTAAQNALRPVLITPGLGSLVSSTGALSPSFSSEVTNYTMNVDYATSQISFLATPINPGATVTMTVNGQPVINGLVPLQVGANTVVITVQDGTGVKQYWITVYRAADSSSGSGGGGGTWTPAPTPPTTKPATTTKIQVALEIDGDNPLEKITVDIERTKHANGDITDFVALTEANAKEAVEKAKQIGNHIARIVIPDVNDEVDKVTVEVPKQSLQTLRDNGLSLEIATENGLIAIPLSSMDGVDDNFYFRLVPVKKESERKAIEERARMDKVVRETLESNDVHVVARPMTIETNMPSRPVQVTLPLNGVKVPTDAAERQAFLEKLAVFIEHSDGEKKVIFPEVVTMAKGELGLLFTVEKFSTFTIIQFENTTVNEHVAYIKGFQDGTFGPEKNVTRAQVAMMIARILGYTDGQTVGKAPFKDVSIDHSAAGAIAFVKEQGIMNGDEHGNFHASQNITRAEMAAVVANYKQLSVDQGVAITFKDTKGHWAQWIIEANRAAGIINGLQDGSFAPNAYLTRAQAVVMINRMFERGPLNGVTTPSFPDVKATHWAFDEIEEAAKSHAYFIDKVGQEQIN